MSNDKLLESVSDALSGIRIIVKCPNCKQDHDILSDCNETLSIEERLRYQWNVLCSLTGEEVPLPSAAVLHVVSSAMQVSNKALRLLESDYRSRELITSAQFGRMMDRVKELELEKNDIRAMTDATINRLNVKILEFESSIQGGVGRPISEPTIGTFEIRDDPSQEESSKKRKTLYPFD